MDQENPCVRLKPVTAIVVGHPGDEALIDRKYAFQHLTSLLQLERVAIIRL